jgi:hypothetical protein
VIVRLPALTVRHPHHVACWGAGRFPEHLSSALRAAPAGWASRARTRAQVLSLKGERSSFGGARGPRARGLAPVALAHVLPRASHPHRWCPSRSAFRGHLHRGRSVFFAAWGLHPPTPSLGGRWSGVRTAVPPLHSYGTCVVVPVHRHRDHHAVLHLLRLTVSVTPSTPKLNISGENMKIPDQPSSPSSSSAAGPLGLGHAPRHLPQGRGWGAHGRLRAGLGFATPPQGPYKAGPLGPAAGEQARQGAGCSASRGCGLLPE